MHILTYKTRIEEIRRESFIEIKEVGEGKGERKIEGERERDRDRNAKRERREISRQSFAF